MTPADPLADLRDIRLPDTPAWDSPEILLTIVVIGLLLAGAARLGQRHRQRAPWRRARAALAAAARQTAAAARVRATSRLWRDYAHQRYPAAALIGADESHWARFLADRAAAPDPTLLLLPYQPAPTATAAAAYLAACRRWLDAHAP